MKINGQSGAGDDGSPFGNVPPNPTSTIRQGTMKEWVSARWTAIRDATPQVFAGALTAAVTSRAWDRFLFGKRPFSAMSLTIYAAWMGYNVRGSKDPLEAAGHASISTVWDKIEEKFKR